MKNPWLLDKFQSVLTIVSSCVDARGIGATAIGEGAERAIRGDLELITFSNELHFSFMEIAISSF